MAGSDLRIGGLPLATLSSPAASGVVEAQIAPGRGMMLLQARGRTPGGALQDLIASPALAEMPAILDGGADDFAGNAAFSFGGAILLPFANRIRGRPLAHLRAIEADLGVAKARLPRNWGGRSPGAEQYAMHGLILDLPFADLETSPGVLRGRVVDHDFGGRWPSRVDIDITWRLAAGALELTVLVENVGPDPTPVGIGWHPYFRIQSGRREQARLRLPAAGRLLVNNYDEVLPTGVVSQIGDSAYDFSGPDGRALGDLHLDDCFVDLARAASGGFTIGIADPAAGCELVLSTHSPQIQAVQIYAPPERAILVVEPQFNWPDPFGRVWPDGAPTGMVLLKPGARASYQVTTRFRPLRTS